MRKDLRRTKNGGPLVDKVTHPISVSEEELYRARLYHLLARLLGSSPDEKLLSFLTSMNGDESPIGQAIGALADVAARVDLEEAVQEYHDLFIGVTQGELLPFASHYLTGFLNEKPLAELRQDMDGLGLARSSNTSDPEDHIASLCEIMRGMIVEDYGISFSLDQQQKFFFRHIENWAPKFFEDLEAAKAAKLYMPVGLLGRLFMNVEGEAFKIAA